MGQCGRFFFGEGGMIFYEKKDQGCFLMRYIYIYYILGSLHYICVYVSTNRGYTHFMMGIVLGLPNSIIFF